MTGKSICAALALCVSLAAIPLFAATYVVPSDEELTQKSDTVVIATAYAQRSYFTVGRNIETETLFAVEESVKGDLVVGEAFAVREPGGVVGNLAEVDTAAPQFQLGDRQMLFLQQRTDGRDGFAMRRFRTADGLLGAFRFAQNGDSGESALVRGGRNESVVGWDRLGVPWAEHPRRANAFVEYVRAVAAGRQVAAGYLTTNRVVPPPTALTAGSAYVYDLTIGTSKPIRVALFDSPTNGSITWKTSGTQPGLDGIAASNAGCDAWSNADGVDVRYSVSGTTTKTARDPNGAYAIIFNDPSGELSGTFTGSGVVANAEFWASNDTNTHGGETYWSIVHSDVVVQDGIQNGVSQVAFNTAMTHELGHSLGFRHSDEGSPSSTHAIMNSSIVGGIGSTLQQWDIDAVTAVYGTAVQVCNAPQITNGPQDVTITSGNSTQLSVSATGTSLTYQWFQGTPPSGSLLNGKTSTTLTISPTSTTSYYVVVSQSCSGNQATSSAATVTVNPPVCDAPSINSNPQNKSVNYGFSTTLSVSAAGSPTLHYQWYTGNSGDTSNPVCTDSSSCNTGALTELTKFWVHVTNSCGSGHADSTAATVTVVCPAITANPNSVSIATGGSTSLSVTAAGAALSYQWYIGQAGDTSTPTGSNASSIFVSPAQTTSYWVQVTGCGSSTANSATATVTVTSCTPPSIDTQPLSVAITTGQSTLLAVGASGTPPRTYQWYIGPAGDTVNSTLIPGATNSTLNVSPTATTSYWVRVGGCSTTVDSVNAVVTVNAQQCPSVTYTVPAAALSLGNGSYTLSATATGGTITYSWFRQNGAGWDLVGSGPSLTIAVPTTATFYVHAQNSCGNSADSAPITITVQSCSNPILTQPGNQNLAPGSSATITVSATSSSGVLHYHWFKGSKGVTTNPVGTDSPTLTTGALKTTTNYWVRVSNDCGNSDSNTITVNMVQGRHRGSRH